MIVLSFGCTGLASKAVESIAAGSTAYHTAVVRADGTLWTWGVNFYGQLGDGTTVSRATPAQVTTLGGTCISAAVGYHFMVAVMSDQTVRAWGYNAQGQLGNGLLTPSTTPVTVIDSNGAILNGVVAVAAGGAHVVALKNNGTICTWGSNNVGQLGDGATTPYRNTAYPVPGISGITAIAAGSGHTLLLKNDGTLLVFGHNGANQLGLGAVTQQSTPTALGGISGVSAITAGTRHSVALLTDGTIKAWGYNFYGQIGNGSTGTSTPPTVISGISGVVAISAGESHTVAAKSNGTVMAWGDNEFGQLGDGTSTNRLVPTAVPGLTGITKVDSGFRRSAAYNSNGQLWMWGSNIAGEIGRAVEPFRTAPVPVPSLANVVSVGVGDTHMVVVKSDGTVWTYGGNAYGQLGDGTTKRRNIPAQVPGLSGVIAVEAGTGHSIALKSDGTVWSWGQNQYGQLGDGTYTERWTPVQMTTVNNAAAISVGSTFTAILRKDGTVYTCGVNSGGQLGDGTFNYKSVPGLVPNVSGVIAIAAGGGHVLALKSDRTVIAWGYNGNGQLGDNTLINRPNAIFVNGLTNVVSIAGGSGHSLAALNDGSVRKWGDGVKIPMLVAGLANVVKVGAGPSQSFATLADQTVKGWGTNSEGQLGDGTTISRATPVIIPALRARAAPRGRSTSSASIRSDGSLTAWGNMSYGQVGIGTSSYQMTPWLVAGINLKYAHPTSSFILPPNNANLSMGQDVAFQLSAAAGLGPIASVSLFYEGIKLGDATTPPYTFEWLPETWGDFRFYAQAVDTNGIYSAFSVPVTLHIAYDSNNNSLPDWWEFRYGVSDPSGDDDGDGISNADESLAGTNPLARDTDDDKLTDGEELAEGTNPTVDDTDGDGKKDGEDGWPLEPLLNPKRVAVPRYAVIEVINGNQFIPCFLNERCDVVFMQPGASPSANWDICYKGLSDTAPSILQNTNFPGHADPDNENRVPVGFDNNGRVYGTWIRFDENEPSKPYWNFSWTPGASSITYTGDGSNPTFTYEGSFQPSTGSSVSNSFSMAFVSGSGGVFGITGTSANRYDLGRDGSISSPGKNNAAVAGYVAPALSAAMTFLKGTPSAGSGEMRWNLGDDNRMLYNDAGDIFYNFGGYYRSGVAPGLSSPAVPATGVYLRRGSTGAETKVPLSLISDMKALNDSLQILGTISITAPLPNGANLSWKSIPAPRINSAKPYPTLGWIDFNNDLRAIGGRSQSGSPPLYDHVVLVNDHDYSLQDLISPDWQLQNTVAINQWGAILAVAKQTTQTQSSIVVLLPVEITARDGKINEGFDPPLEGDIDINGVDDKDNWVPWTRVAKGGTFQTNELTQLVTGSNSVAQALEVVPANDSVNLIEVPTRFPNAANFPLTITGKASSSTSVNKATVEVRLRNSSPIQVVARLKVLVVPDMPTTELKFYFVSDSRFYDVPVGNSPNMGTKVRDDAGGPGSMAGEADVRFRQFGAYMALAGPTESRDVPYLGPPDYYTDPVNQTGPRWLNDYCNPQSALVIQLFPRQLYNGGDIASILVHRVGGDGIGYNQAGYYSPETELCFINYDKWFPGVAGDPPYPYWGGNIPPVALVPDSIGREATRHRVYAHEIGHALLPVQNRRGPTEPVKPPVNNWQGGHDSGPAPQGTDALMRGDALAKGKGKWLRHEDWEIGIEELKRRMAIP